MSDYTDRQAAALIKLEAATTIVDAFANGAADDTVQTDSGMVPSVAKLAADLGASYMQAASIYADTTTGLAATPDGKFFSVPGADVDDYTILYKNNAGVAVEVKRYSSASKVLSMDALLGPVAATYIITPAKNLYDPSLAVDGNIYNATSGAIGAYADGIASGLVPVIEGNTYTFSQPSPEAGFLRDVFAWSDTAYLGMSGTSLGAPVVIDGMNPVYGDAGGTGGFRTLTFTIPVGSGITHVGAYLLFGYAAHTTADFDRIRNATQLELGSVATSFEAYGTPGDAILKDAGIPDTIQRAAPVSPLLDAFDVAASRNVYDKSVAVDGATMNYGSGLAAVYANGMSLGYFPVTAGNTYTLSMGDALGFVGVLFCRDSTGAFLGIDHTIGATVGMASPPTGIAWTGNTAVTFTIPAGSAIAYVGVSAAYSAHTTDDFNRVIATVQAEIGSSVTGYQPYAPNGIATLKESALPSGIPGIGSSGVVPPVRVERVGSMLYVRGSFDDTNDIIQQVSLGNGPNNTVNVMGARTASKDVVSNVTGWASGVQLWGSGDSSAPPNYFGTYIGANHGADYLQLVTSSAHGKTMQDVGSEWIDGASVKWYLMQIVDVDTLQFLSANTNAYPAWSFTNTITGATLTHSAGATNTSAVAVNSSTLAQLTPSLQNQTAKVMLDGVTEAAADGVYYCDFVDVVNVYDIANPAAVLAYVRSKVGEATQPSFIDPSILSDIHRTLTYRYSENGSCTITDGVRAINSLPWFGYFPATQAEALIFTGKQLWHYVPRVTPIVGSLKTWDFSSQAEIDGAMEMILYESTNWTDANNPPDRSAQIVKSSGVAEFGMMVGISPIRGTGPAATRKTLTGNGAGFVSAARKSYLFAIGSPTPITAGSYFETVAYRAFWSASANPDATTFAWYRDGKDVVVIADWHKNVDFSALQLPDWLIGRDVIVVDKTASVTVHGNGVLTAGGVLVSVADGYGYLVLRLA